MSARNTLENKKIRREQRAAHKARLAAIEEERRAVIQRVLDEALKAREAEVA